MMLSMTPNKQCGDGLGAFFGEESDRLDYWSGGAQKDWLSGAVNQEASAQIMDGKLPDGTAMAGRRMGYDCSFSEPKSLSIQALVGRHE